MRGTISAFKIAGIPVGFHYSWFVVVGLFSWYMSRRLLPEGYLFHGTDPGWPAATYWATGIIVSLLLFASVLFHELAHSIVARARGFPVEGITLFLLGGVSDLGEEATGARDEFVISVVGPLSSLLLFGVLWFVVLAVPSEPSPITAIVRYLCFINLVMALFNLLPAFPMDGGRVLRSIVWAATGSVGKATLIAARGGQVIGLLLIAFGIFQAINGSVLAGVWAGFIGWFLFSSATHTRKEKESKVAEAVVRIGEVMEKAPSSIGPDATVADAMFTYILRDNSIALPVCEAGRLQGMITLADVNRIPREQWRYVSVRQVMTPLPLWALAPEDELSKAIELLAERSLDQVPIVVGGRLVGLLSRADVINYIHTHESLHNGAKPEDTDHRND